MPDYKRLSNAVITLVSGPKGLPGTLGYMVNGQWRVVDPDDPRKFFVRFAEGTFVSAFHKGRVIQKPDLPVLVGTDKYNRPIILGTDPARINDFNSGSDTVGPHSHARNTGREYITDTWLLKQLRMTVYSGLTVIVDEGVYLWEGSLHYWPQTTKDLTAYMPTLYGGQAWIVVGIDPTNEVLVARTGDADNTGTTIDIDSIPLIEFVEDRFIPIAAIRAYTGSTTLINFNIEDLRFLGGLGGSALALHDLTDVDISSSSPMNGDILEWVTPDNRWENRPLSDFTDRILTGHTGQVLAGHTGLVLIGPAI